MLFHCSHFDRNEIQFRVKKYHVNNTRNEIISKKTSAHAFILSKQKYFYWMGHFSRTTPKTKFNFILLAMKSNVNRISFMEGWFSYRVDFILGLIKTPSNSLPYADQDKLRAWYWSSSLGHGKSLRQARFFGRAYFGL